MYKSQKIINARLKLIFWHVFCIEIGTTGQQEIDYKMDYKQNSNEVRRRAVQGHRYGCHRVIEPQNSLPQPAWKLDHTLPIYDNELLIEVERLNIDSASFKQLKEAAQENVPEIQQQILSIIQERGKMHNPVTGSGGMLIGRIIEKGPNHPDQSLKVGDRIASLVSLTLTPLNIKEITSIDLQTAQIAVQGYAILFASSPYAILPTDLPENLALAALDVCGAPAQVAQLVQEGQTVVVLGAGGKSGLLSLYQARKSTGKTGKIIAIEYDASQCEKLKELNMADIVLQGNAQEALPIFEQIEQLTSGALADVVINCVNVPHTEMTTILCTKSGGTAYFFSMATSFTAAALGAEGVGKDIKLMIGNGYTAGHADLTLNLLRESLALQELWLHKFA